MKKDFVSVIIPAYNRETTIVRAIDSVLSQTYPNIECIVVDDCSKDNTATVIKEAFGKDERVHYYKLPHNSGACVARNKGVELAQGEYVAFLDSDDLYRPEKIEKQMDAIKKTGADFCSSGFVSVGIDGSETIVLPYKGTKEEIFNNLLFLNCITTGVLMGKRSCMLETPFDNNQPRYQDWDIALRLYKKYPFVFIEYIGLELIRQEVSISSSTSHQKSLKALHVIYDRNKGGFDKCSRANTQIHWLMGLHSLFVPGQRDLRSLWKGVVGNGFSIHRFGVFLAVLFGMKNHFIDTIQNI